MIPFKLRKKILYKLAQISPIAPTEKEVNQAPNIGTPPQFIATNMYPTLTTAFSSAVVEKINKLSDYLNDCIFYSSAGKYNMKFLYNMNFNFTPTISDNKDLKYLMLFAKEFYKNIYNSGNVYTKPLNQKEFKDKFNILLQSQYLNNLSQTNPTGQLAIKMGGNIKPNIINDLKALLAIAPTQ